MWGRPLRHHRQIGTKLRHHSHLWRERLAWHSSSPNAGVGTRHRPRPNLKHSCNRETPGLTPTSSALAKLCARRSENRCCCSVDVLSAQFLGPRTVPFHQGVADGLDLLERFPGPSRSGQ
jgi:hypothetical protein